MDEIRNKNFRSNRPRPPGDRNGASPKYRQRPGPGHGRQNGTGSGNSAQRNYERYLALAREAALSGDNVEMENCYQHAEHYFRVMKERTS